MVYAVWRMPPAQGRRPEPWLPSAKIEDGTRLAHRSPPAPRSPNAGIGLAVLGLIMMFFGGCAGVILQM